MAGKHHYSIFFCVPYFCSIVCSQSLRYIYIHILYRIRGTNWVFLYSNLLTEPGSKEALWTCEKDSKARGCQQVPRDTCKFDNIESLISKADLEAMKKVKIAQQSKRFQKWLSIAKKGTFCSEAFCTQHLKMCLSLTFQTLFAFGHWLHGKGGKIIASFRDVDVSSAKLITSLPDKYIFDFIHININIYVFTK